MTSEEPKSPALFRFFPIVEKIFLCAVTIGVVLAIAKIDFLILRISLIGLAAVFFLSAFRPPAAIESSADNAFGFSQMLALVIVPKVLWIGSAVSVLGIGLCFLSLGNEGYKQALLSGTLSIVVCLTMLTVFWISGTKQLKIVVPILMRAVPVFLAGLYFLLK